MNKTFQIYFIILLPVLLIVMVVPVASAQFAFELPSRAAERFNSYDDIEVVVTGKLTLSSHTERGHIFLDVKGGIAPYSFKWDSRQTTQNRMNLISGTYTVEIKDAAGTKYAEQIIIQPPGGLTLIPIQKITASWGSEYDRSSKIRKNSYNKELF